MGLRYRREMLRRWCYGWGQATRRRRGCPPCSLSSSGEIFY